MSQAGGQRPLRWPDARIPSSSHSPAGMSPLDQRSLDGYCLYPVAEPSRLASLQRLLVSSHTKLSSATSCSPSVVWPHPPEPLSSPEISSLPTMVSPLGLSLRDPAQSCLPGKALPLPAAPGASFLAFPLHRVLRTTAVCLLIAAPLCPLPFLPDLQDWVSCWLSIKEFLPLTSKNTSGHPSEAGSNPTSLLDCYSPRFPLACTSGLMDGFITVCATQLNTLFSAISLQLYHGYERCFSGS